MHWIKRASLFLVLLVAASVLIGVGVLVVQGKQKPDTQARYVALGSSFAAGLGLGERIPGSPLVCQRSANGYPQQLARQMVISLTDMTCSGATITHVLRGGQFFQGPQIDALGPATELVTLTAGGNDINYVGDLVLLSYQQRGGIFGAVLGRFWHGAKPAAERQFEQLQSEMVATLGEIAKRAPHAQIVVITYPAILPATGTCAQIGISEIAAARMREVGARLAEVTRAAAQATGTTLIDMTTAGAGHDACSAEPWVNGAKPAHGALFHPTLAGAQAAARQIQLTLDQQH